MQNTILITDAVGLVGAYIIRALLTAIPLEPSLQNVDYSPKILAGYHSSSTLAAAQQQNDNPGIVEPILVDWNNQSTYTEAVRAADSVLILTPFTSQKAEQVESWMRAIKAAAETRFEAPHSENSQGNTSSASFKPGEKANKTIHVVHVGLHTSPTASHRPPHESWFLDAEQKIKTLSDSSAHLTHTLLRVNFDGYNTLLRPERISYYLPPDVRYGWMAREDIASFAAKILLVAQQHTNPAASDGRVHVLSASLISLDDMATAASEVVGFPIKAENLSISAFEQMALTAQPGDQGYTAYIRSIASMFEGLGKGEFPWHREIYPEKFEAVVGRKPMEFRDWLETSEFRPKLGVPSKQEETTHNGR